MQSLSTNKILLNCSDIVHKKCDHHLSTAIRIILVQYLLCFSYCDVDNCVFFPNHSLTALSTSTSRNFA